MPESTGLDKLSFELIRCFTGADSVEKHDGCKGDCEVNGCVQEDNEVAAGNGYLSKNML